MTYKVHKPSNELNNYISEIAYIKDYYPEHRMDKLLPDGSLNLIFELQGKPKYIFDNITKKPIQECRDTWFSGLHNNYITISAHSEEMLVVTFKPGCVFPVINENVDSYTNKVVNGHLIFGESVMQLHVKLKTEKSPDKKFSIIEKWIAKRLKINDFQGSIIKQCVELLEKNNSINSIKSLAEISGYSQKQFIALFKKYVGLSPKQYQRIVRFNKIINVIEQDKHIAWAKISNDYGFFDQAHFIKDFQSFSGLNPKTYLSDIGEYPNYFPVK